MIHRYMTEDLRIFAVDYVLGFLSHAQAAALTAHLDAGCKVCADEVRANRRLIELLSVLEQCEGPPPALRDRLLVLIASDLAESSGCREAAHVQAVSIPEGWTVIRKGQKVWMPGQGKASAINQLSHSQAEGSRILQIRLGAEGLYPGFHCGGTAELYVLGGDLLMNGEWLGTGDYGAATAGTLLHDMESRNGCEFILLRPEAGEHIDEGDATSLNVIVVRASDETWLPTRVPGVTVKPLFLDRARLTQTYLVRALPGSRMPSHRHVTADQTFFLVGDGRIGSMLFEAGDFYRAEAGTVHEISWTESGCLCLTLASAADVAG